MSVAALYACLIRWLMAARSAKAGCRSEPLTELIAEDRWIAQRYGVFAFFGDRTSGTGRVDIADYLSEIVDALIPDAQALGCEAEIRRTPDIVMNGTSADRQLDHYRLRRLEGDSRGGGAAPGGRHGARRDPGASRRRSRMTQFDGNDLIWIMLLHKTNAGLVSTSAARSRTWRWNSAAPSTPPKR